MSLAIAEIERLYTLDEVADLLTFPTVAALRTCLWRNPDLAPARYRRRGPRLIRLLTASDLEAIRRHLVK